MNKTSAAQDNEAPTTLTALTDGASKAGSLHNNDSVRGFGVCSYLYGVR
jgi:hypothetical protein